MAQLSFFVKNELSTGKQVLTLSGPVRKKYADDDACIDAKTIEQALQQSTSPLTIRLNSVGGDVFEGIEIYNLLRASERYITVEVTALAASAASIIAMGADRIVMTIGSSLMIHEASSFAWGNKKDLQKVLQALETIDESILDIYADKTGQSKKVLSEYLEKETWFTAQEAVDQGFADEIKQKEEKVTPVAENKQLKIFGG